MGQKPDSKEEAVLVELCGRFGYCLPGSIQADLLARSTYTPSGLVDAVIVADGLDPATVPHRTRMIERAEQIFRSSSWSNEP